MLSDGSFEFELRKEIEVYGCNGPVSSVTLHECGEGYDSYYMKLRKHVSSAQMKAPKMMEDLKSFIPTKDSDDELASGEEVKALHTVTDDDHDDQTEGFAVFLKMILGTSDELEKLVEVFGFMVAFKGRDPICTSNGVLLKEAAWKRLHIEDKIDVAVKYCAFFGIGLDKASNKKPETVSDLHTAQKVL